MAHTADPEFWQLYRALPKAVQERAVLATEEAGGLHWFWIGSHADYDKVLRN